MSTPVSSNGDIAHQSRAQSARNAAPAAAYRPGEAQDAGDAFAALFGLAMSAQGDAAPITLGPADADKQGLAAGAETDESLTGAPVDTAALLASIPWHVAPSQPQAPAVPVPGAQAIALSTDAQAVPEGGDFAARQAQAGTDPALGVAASVTDPATLAAAQGMAGAVAVPADLARLAQGNAEAQEPAPGLPAAAGVRRPGAGVGASAAGLAAQGARSAGADAAQAGADQEAAFDLKSADLRGQSTGPVAGNGQAAAASSLTERAVAPVTTASGVVAAPVDAAQAATPHALPSARHEVPTVPGPPTQVHQPAMQARVDEAVRWMSTQDIQEAEIRVTPDDLGPVSVHLRMDGDVATVTFVSQHEQTRQVLENSLGSLRDALASSGLQLGQAQVGSEQPHNAFADADGQGGNGRGQGGQGGQGVNGEAGDGRSNGQQTAGNGLVDLYA